MNVDHPPFNFISLFSGGGGLDLGIARAVPGARTVVHVEIEAYACAVLAARMAEGSMAACPIWTDVTTFDGRPWRGVVDCVAGGSPCQDLSVAGKRAGLDGERSGLFWQFVRVVEEVRPRFVCWENVGGAVGSLPRVFDAFAALGYEGAATVVHASDVGAPHRRARIFLLGRLADANARREQQSGWALARLGRRLADGGEELADARDARLQGLRSPGRVREEISRADCHGRPEWPPGPAGDWSGIEPRFFPAQPRFRGVDDGVAGGLEPSVSEVESCWADRLRLLGNGVVPAQAAEAFRFLWRNIQ